MPDAPGVPLGQVVVIGASAGGVEALRTVVAGLPADLPAAVVVVLHVPRNSPGMLAGILDRAGPLPAVAAEHGSVLRPGAVHVAPPDHHVLVSDGRLVLSTGPTENGHRPAVDPLFRSAALARGPAAVGVVLSGTRDDGAAGLVSLVEHGGTAVVQDPQEALFAATPRHALELVPEAVVLPSDRIAAALDRIVRAGPERADRAGRRARSPVAQQTARDEVSIATTGLPTADEVHGARPSPFSCPSATACCSRCRARPARTCGAGSATRGRPPGWRRSRPPRWSRPCGPRSARWRSGRRCSHASPTAPAGRGATTPRRCTRRTPPRCASRRRACGSSCPAPSPPSW